MAEAEELKCTKYEKARIIGSRALQIAMGAPFLIELSESDLEGIKYNPLEIAKMEFEKGVVPISVRRKLPKIERPEEEAAAAKALEESKEEE